MIKAQLNTLRWYSVKANRNWDNSHNKQQHIVFSLIDSSNHVFIPATQLIVAAAYGTPTLSICLNRDDSVKQTVNMTVENETGYDRIKYFGAYTSFTTGEDFYYLKITNGAYTYYSDVFAATSDVDDLLKVVVTSSNIAVGENADYELNLASFTFIAYLNVWRRDAPVYEEEELANTYNGTIVPYYHGVSEQQMWVVSGNEYILKFLSKLRLLQLNGAVTLTWKNESYSANDIEVAVEESYNDGSLLDISIKIKPYNEVFTTINEIN